MKIVFVGGGSYRILPMLRGVVDRYPQVLAGGEIRLVDREVSRAEAVGRMLQRTPEWPGAQCSVTWGSDLDRALDGADLLYVTMALGSPLATLRSHQASMKRGFISSDQLSLTGGFLSLIGGPVILDFARRMERYCPQAPMLIFANPVAVYSGMVNNHTRIRALGICGGFANHRWDLTRLLTSRDECCEDYTVDVAGVNHLSFILRGTCRGEDLYAALDRVVGPGWQPPRIHKEMRWLAPHIHYALRKLIYMYQRFGTIIFSTEGDGMTHLFYEEMFARAARRFKPTSLARMQRAAAQAVQARQDADARFRAHLDQPLDAAFWRQPWHQNRWFGRDDGEVTGLILKGLAGLGPEQIVASRPCRGAVAGFKDRTVLEYSIRVTPDGFAPAGTYVIPDCFHGLIGSLATYQTLLGDAVATGDPRVLADALFAYPVKQNTRDARMLGRELLAIWGPEIPAAFQQTGQWL